MRWRDLNTAVIEGAVVTLVSAEQADPIQVFAEVNSSAWPKFLDGDEAVIEYCDSHILKN